MSTIELSKFIRKTALDLGFSMVGIAPANTDSLTEKRFNNWLKNGYHASMGWMKNRAVERGDVKQYFPEVKSVVSLGLNYFTGSTHNSPEIGKISNYAWGDDYHELIISRLYKLLGEIKSTQSGVNGLICVDTSPLMEKAWAQKAGLGWIGKHTNLINRDFGSWIFLGEVLLNIELEYDPPFIEDLCGTCTACLDACPTSAFPEPYVLDASKCISYLTIEHRGELPMEMEDKLSGWIYGCDICQEICPWNIKFSQITDEKTFLPRDNLQERPLSQWSKLSENEYQRLFKKSAIKRTKFAGLKRNINSVTKSLDESIKSI